MATEKIWIAESTLRRSVGAALKREGFTDAEIESTLNSWLYAEYSGKASHGFERLLSKRHLARRRLCLLFNRLHFAPGE